MAKKNSFGNYIKLLRTTRDIGQRELARRLDISCAYLNDIEKGKRKSPSQEIIKKLADELEGNLEHLYDLAGLVSNKVPHDIEELLIKSKADSAPELSASELSIFTKSAHSNSGPPASLF